MKQYISIIIPIFREENNILKVLGSIEENVHTLHEIVIVFDGNDDPTVHVVSSYIQTKKIKNVRLIKNNSGNQKGVMNAIKTGFHVAKGTAIVVVMADLADDITQIDTMYTLLEQGYDIICASRFMKGGKKIGGPIIKTLLSRFACITLHEIFKIPTHDATNAFKMYRTSLFSKIAIESTGGFEYSLEIILKAFKQGYKITEIPTIWKDREEGKSNFKLLAWLPHYIKWYTSIFPNIKYSQKQRFIFSYIFLFFGVCFFAVLQIGAALHNGIALTSTLDFSWNTDSVERLLHGYIAGRDFVFTYGPLFQFINALPSLVFHIPSYIGVIYSPLLMIALIFFIIVFIARSVTNDTNYQFLITSLCLLLLGVSNTATANQLLRSLFPMVYVIVLTSYVFRNKSNGTLLLVAILPTVFGTYTYDLFLQCLLIFSLYFFYTTCTQIYALSQQRIAMLRTILKSKTFVTNLLILCGICVCQVFFSLTLSGGLGYVHYSLITVTDYLYIENTAWEFGKSNYLFIFPLGMLFFYVLLLQDKKITDFQKKIWTGLMVVSLLSIRSVLVRSDAGHIEISLYPSIIMTFIFLVLLMKNRNIIVYCIGIMLFVIVPFRVNYYPFLSGKNILAFIHTLKYPASFFSVYTLPANYYYTNSDFEYFSHLIAQNRNNVLIYPYDSFILNISGSTFNSFPLQFYDYSSSSVEEKAVQLLALHPPKFIVLSIDTVGAIQLDNIPNFSRNPLLAQWMIQRYRVVEKKKNFVVLSYAINKNIPNQLQMCLVYKIHFIPKQRNIGQYAYSLVKSPLYLFNNKLDRLPYKKAISEYYIFNNLTNADSIAQLFSQPFSLTAVQQMALPNTSLQILREDPFSKHITKLLPSEMDFRAGCI